MVNIIIRSFCIIICISLIACRDQAVYDQVFSIPPEGWNYNEKVNFTFAISDTMASYDILMHVRNTKNYSYSNLWVFIETYAPNGNIQRDTFEIILADELGRWMGKSKQSVNTLLIPYKTNVKFPGRGVYQASIQHAMRDTALRHITDVGFRIKYYSPK